MKLEASCNVVAGGGEVCTVCAQLKLDLVNAAVVALVCVPIKHLFSSASALWVTPPLPPLRSFVWAFFSSLPSIYNLSSGILLLLKRHTAIRLAKNISSSSMSAWIEMWLQKGASKYWKESPLHLFCQQTFISGLEESLAKPCIWDVEHTEGSRRKTDIHFSHLLLLDRLLSGEKSFIFLTTKFSMSISRQPAICILMMRWIRFLTLVKTHVMSIPSVIRLSTSTEPLWAFLVTDHFNSLISVTDKTSVIQNREISLQQGLTGGQSPYVWHFSRVYVTIEKKAWKIDLLWAVT